MDNRNDGFEFYDGELQQQMFSYFMVTQMLNDDLCDICDCPSSHTPCGGTYPYARDPKLGEFDLAGTPESYTKMYQDYPDKRRCERKPQNSLMWNLPVYACILFYIFMILRALAYVL